MPRYGYVSGDQIPNQRARWSPPKTSSAADAHALFVDAKADNSELGWRMEVKHNGDDWHFVDDTEGAPD